MVTLQAPAKLNLYLHVTGKRSDGYHLLDSLVVFLPDLCDRITLEKSEALSFKAGGLVPDDAHGMNNLAVKAVKAVADAAARAPDVHITLHKNIPAGAGLGGGSADAAAAVAGLEQLWDISIEEKERNRILLSLGADVPVCYHGAPCRFEGIGEIISDVPALPSFAMLLVWPDCHSATQAVFKGRAPHFRKDRVEIPASFANLNAFIAFLAETGNDLQAAAENLYPPIAAARRFIAEQAGCSLARMSGSGSCVFGIFEDAAACKGAQAALQAAHPSWWTHTAAL